MEYYGKRIYRKCHDFALITHVRFYKLIHKCDGILVAVSLGFVDQHVTSNGNVVILGSCRGNVYAGAGGDRSCFVAALIMKPIQIRIADKMARSAITKRSDNMVYALDPKIAFVKDDHIYVKNLVHNTIREILGESDKDPA